MQIRNSKSWLDLKNYIFFYNGYKLYTVKHLSCVESTWFGLEINIILLFSKRILRVTILWFLNTANRLILGFLNQIFMFTSYFIPFAKLKFFPFPISLQIFIVFRFLNLWIFRYDMNVERSEKILWSWQYFSFHLHFCAVSKSRFWNWNHKNI